MTIRAGDFWLVDIPFTDGSSSKKRPVLVLWLDGPDAVVAAVTSAAPRSPTDVLLAELASRRSTTAFDRERLSRLDCLEQFLLIHRLSAFSASDAQRVTAIWSLHVKPQF